MRRDTNPLALPAESPELAKMDRGRREHHLERPIAAGGQILAHDAISILRHHGKLGYGMKRVDAESQKHDSERLGNPAHQVEMGVELVAGFVNRAQRRAREFELPAGFERDARAILDQRDDVSGLMDRLPVIVANDGFEQRTDATLSGVGDGRMVVTVQADLFVFGSDLPEVGRLLSGTDEVHQRVDRFDRRVEVQAHSTLSCGREEPSCEYRSG
jgi:hypothetical protein